MKKLWLWLKSQFLAKKPFYMKLLALVAMVFLVWPLNQIVIHDTIPYYLDLQLQQAYEPWFNQLSVHNWDYDTNHEINDYLCQSEAQAVGLYASNHGFIWNECLENHCQKHHYSYETISELDNEESHIIDNQDYNFLLSALQKAHSPYELCVYHPVQYDEIQWFNQLKRYLLHLGSNYLYYRCVHKYLTSSSFLSCTLQLNEAMNYLNYVPHQIYHTKPVLNPLKEPVIFKIRIPQNHIGVAYLGNFSFMGLHSSNLQQVILQPNMQFYISKVGMKIINGRLINLFELTLV